MTGLSSSTVRRFARSPTNRLSWSRTSPLRLSSPLRIPVCSTNSAASARTANCDLGGTASHLPVRLGMLELGFPHSSLQLTRICEAGFGLLHLNEGNAFRTVALHNVPQALADFVRQRGSFKAPTGVVPVYRPLQVRDVIYTADETAESNPGVAAANSAARGRLSRCRCSRMRAGRRRRYLPSGGPPVHRQADRACREFRRPSRHRHREHAAA